MTAAATSEFDRDTALEPLGDGRWLGHVDPSWYVTTGPNGGFLAALATRALEAATGRAARSLTLHFLAAPHEGPIEVAATVARAGGTSTFTRLELGQGDTTIALGLGVAAEWREGEPEWSDQAPPEVPALADATPFDPHHERIPVYFRKYEMRWALGALGVPDAPARIGAWMRAAGGRPLDAPLLAAMSDALMPPAFVRTGLRALVPTVDLTLHFRLPVPDATEWVLGVFESQMAAGGAVDEDGRLFAPDGRLLLQSRQLALLRSPRK